MEIIIILALIIINGIFSMSEMALVSAKKFKLENAFQKNKSGAKAAIELSDNPNKFLSTVQIGITLIGILVGIFSGKEITAIIAVWISNITSLAPYASEIASVLVVMLVTFVSIVLGELLPKRLGMAYPEPIAMFMAKPMHIISKITSPFVWLLTHTNDLILSVLGIKNIGESAASEEEIKSILKESVKGGEISNIEQDIVERVFELGDTKVDHIFTHKNDVTFFSLEDSWQDIKDKIYNDKHSAYPVSKDQNLDNITGVVILKDLFTPDFAQHFDINSVIRKPLFVNENTYAYNVLEQFKSHKTHYGIVIDEYGSVKGIVTMDDVMDALIGDMQDADDDEYEVLKRDDNSWLVDGQYSLKEFLKQFPLDIDDATIELYNTVAGLIMSRVKEIPMVGTKIKIDDYILEVIDKDGQRIDKILVEKK